MQGISSHSKRIKKSKKEGAWDSSLTSDEENPESSSQEYHVTVKTVSEETIPKELYTITDQNIFAALIYPVNANEFYANYFAKRALVIKGGSSRRFDKIVSEQMYELDVREMCENNASDRVHIWFPNRDVGEGTLVKSFSTDDYELATTAYERGGASLYFGSSKDFRISYCKKLTY